MQSGHYEIKLATLTAYTPSPQPTPLLDATQLSTSSPTSFICASCSLPLIQSSRITQYRDLPSEHWQELVDAWMCHSDQKLHEQIAKNGRGFWPEPGQTLVGGSYILFEESAMSKINLYPADTAKVCSHFIVLFSLFCIGRSRRPTLDMPTNGRSRSVEPLLLRANEALGGFVRVQGGRVWLPSTTSSADTKRPI